METEWDNLWLHWQLWMFHPISINIFGLAIFWHPVSMNISGLTTFCTCKVVFRARSLLRFSLAWLSFQPWLAPFIIEQAKIEKSSLTSFFENLVLSTILVELLSITMACTVQALVSHFVIERSKARWNFSHGLQRSNQEIERPLMLFGFNCYLTATKTDAVLNSKYTQKVCYKRTERSINGRRQGSLDNYATISLEMLQVRTICTSENYIWLSINHYSMENLKLFPRYDTRGEPRGNWRGRDPPKRRDTSVQGRYLFQFWSRKSRFLTCQNSKIFCLLPALSSLVQDFNFFHQLTQVERINVYYTSAKCIF
jgi:hypothetical protein